MQEFAAENAAFCEKVDLKRGTNKYNQCLLDTGQFRLNAEKRVLDTVYWRGYPAEIIASAALFALGQKQTFAMQQGMSALPQKRWPADGS